MLAAVVVAPLAVVAYGEMHRQVVRAAGADLSGRVVQAVTVAGNAMSATLPAGGSTTAVIWSAWALGRRGVPTAVATVTVATAALVSTVVLAMLVPVLLAAAGVLAAPVGLALLAAALATVVILGAAARSSTVLTTALTRVLRVLARVPWTWLHRRTGDDPDATARAWAAQVRPVVPGPWVGVRLMVVAGLMYAADLAALAAATRSVLPAVPWAAVALGWVVGQVGMALQLTPGGLGLVEAGLGGALLAAGIPVPEVAVVVAVYRGADWLLPALVGWAVYLLLPLQGVPSPLHRDLPRRGE